MTSQFSTGEEPYIYGFIIGSKGFTNNQVQKVPHIIHVPIG